MSLKRLLRKEAPPKHFRKIDDRRLKDSLFEIKDITDDDFKDVEVKQDHSGP